MKCKCQKKDKDLCQIEMMDEKPQELKLDMVIYGILMLFRRGCSAITELMLNGP